MKARLTVVWILSLGASACGLLGPTEDQLALELRVLESRVEVSWTPHILCATEVEVLYLGQPGAPSARVVAGQVVYRSPGWLDLDTRYDHQSVESVWGPAPITAGVPRTARFERLAILRDRPFTATHSWTVETASGARLTATDEVTCT